MLSPPRYLNLLSEKERVQLKPLLKVVRERREEILKRWYEKYLEHFATSRTLDEPSFFDLFMRDLVALTENLLGDDLEGFEADMRRLGSELFERGVTFTEVVASLHLLEESTAEEVSALSRERGVAENAFLLFDRLSHCRIILLGSSYFGTREAEVGQRLKALEEEVRRLGKGVPRAHFYGLIGQSRRMQHVYEQIAAAAPGQGTVLVLGESGTGKELVARAVHELGGKGARPFVAVNCAALPRELIESELFGAKRGAFTGAQRDAIGLVRAAHGGTLFLDEITEMAPETQAKLLRALEEHKVRPVGFTEEIAVDVRFVASTNRDPEEAVEQGALRHDLFYRLNVHRIELPPLRERIEDIPLLVDHFTKLLAARGQRQVEGIAPDALGVLERYRWPGNVRELRGAVEHALAVGKGKEIVAEDLPAYILRRAGDAPKAKTSADGPVPTLEEAEHNLIVRALQETGGNKLKAARMLGISRHRLYDRLKRFGIDAE